MPKGPHQAVSQFSLTSPFSKFKQKKAFAGQLREKTALLVWGLVAVLGVVGCGSGGYAGGGLVSLSSSAITIDAGQSVDVTASVSGGPALTWTVTGSTCSGTACGVFSGTEDLSGTYTAPSGITAPLHVTATVGVAGTSNFKSVTITVNPAPTITGGLPTGVVGTPYSATMVAAGGTGTLHLTLANGSLPAGLSFDGATGVISGVPTVTGTATFGLKLVDSSDVPFTLNVTKTITVVTSGGGGTIPMVIAGAPPAGTVGSAYSYGLTVTGGVAPYTWSRPSGSLPSGLTLNAATGVISGVPTTQGSSVFTAQVLDSAGASAIATFSITINAGGGTAPTLTLATATLPGGTVGVAYSATIGVTGGVSPYSCSVTTGTLPAGLSLSGCTVSGTPTVAGTSSLTVRATDSSTPAGVVTGPESITISPAPLSLALTSLPDATVGTPYSATISATGGTSPYICQITAGTLPAGLALSGCVISGTPTTPGLATLAVKVTDSSNPALTANGPVSLRVNPAALVLTLSPLPAATVGIPYTATIGVTGGTAPYFCTITSGTLPAGLNLSGCAISGTPTVAGTANLIVRATDSSTAVETTQGPETLVVQPATVVLTLTSPPGITVNTPYTGTIGVTGGTGPYICALQAGSTLPAGLSLSSSCVITGTATTPGNTTVQVIATDSSSPVVTKTGPISLVVSPAPLSLALTPLPGATVGIPYTATIGVTGGTAPYFCTVIGGTLPAGLSLSGCVISGTPTVSGTANLIVRATDSSTPVETTQGPETLVVQPATVVLTISSPPIGIVNVPYVGVIVVLGGTGPYNCSLQVGSTLPAGLSLTGCIITGTPTTTGTTTVDVVVTDSGTPVATKIGPISIVINPAPLTLGLTPLPAATVGVPYTATIDVTGGTSPYFCTVIGGTLPAGLSLSGCVISGTPTIAGTANLTVRATDSSLIVQTTQGPETLVVQPAPATLTITSPPMATINTPYTGTIGVTGGTAPYTCALQVGSTLPAGLTLSNSCVISGTPTTVGNTTVQVIATDSSSPVVTKTGPVSLVVDPAPLTLTLATLPSATVGTPYTATIGVSGGTAPYFCTVISGTLPAGLNLAGCVISGTPTVAGTANLVVRATDSSVTVETTQGPETLVVQPAAAVLTITSPPGATINTPYTGTVGVTGGTAPYSCALQAGSTLPAGLTLSSACVISGTPTVIGNTTVQVIATDGSSPAVTKTGPVTIAVAASTATLTLSSPPNATVSTPYTGLIGVTGGTAPYTCQMTAGTLPAGLTIANCTISGTPVSIGSTAITILATDSNSATTSGPVTITVDAIPALTLTGSLPNAVQGQLYTQTLTATGGLTPYSYAVSAGALPAGLTLSSAGVLSGTPTTVGASSFTVTVTDSQTPVQTASLPLVLLVTYPLTPNDGELTGPYAFLFEGYDDVLAGVLAYRTATAGSFTADGAAAITAGEMDSNHQTSTATGATIDSNLFLGTYTVGTDHRGLITLTTLNTDGTTALTSTYAIALKAPVSPATNAVQGSLIEFDNNNLQGTKGSGTLLAQTTGSFTNGLTGSFAFGLQGDTPCLPTCTIGVIAGPAASVGQLIVTAGTVTGTVDANVAATNFATQVLTGSALAADGNGRLELSMTTAGLPAGVYPTDYAVYMVDANRSFIVSTDKHSAYILLAGSAQVQTASTFTNASMTGPFVGYENSPTNPGLVGALLQNVLNLTTATVFHGTAAGTGNCNVDYVDVGGTVGLVNGLTGLGSGNAIINALLGTYESVGISSCTVAPNGRAVFNYPPPSGLLPGLLALLGLSGAPPPPRILYLSSTNEGYFLETGYAGLGNISLQTGAPFTLATLDGSYVSGTSPASSVASITGSGTFVSNGAGQATTTSDQNIGVGTLNILQLGVTTTNTYALTDAAAGRFLLQPATVIYAISPGRFVLLDTSPLSTSPSISLLY